MQVIKLQYSLLCELDKKDSFINIIHGFEPGYITAFYVVNKWVWDERNKKNIDMSDDGYYQVCSIIAGNKIIANSSSKPFRLKLAHTHHNHFQDIEFKTTMDYRIKVKLFNKKGEEIKKAGIEYPLFVREE